MDPKPKLGRSESENLAYYNNKGQEDAAKGEYNSQSYGLLNSDADARNSDAYDRGWRNTTDQSDD